jgi:hypothetical protein
LVRRKAHEAPVHDRILLRTVLVLSKSSRRVTLTASQPPSWAFDGAEHRYSSTPGSEAVVVVRVTGYRTLTGRTLLSRCTLFGCSRPMEPIHFKVFSPNSACLVKVLETSDFDYEVAADGEIAVQS